MDITVKGVDDKLLINIQAGDWQIRQAALLEYVNANAGFLSGAKVVLCLEGFSLKVNDLFKLKNDLLDHHINLNGLIADTEETRQSARLLGIPLELAAKERIEQKTQPVAKHKIDKNLFIEKTLRSGSLTETDGNITILADVHPGAVIRATGSVIVWGKLNGEVHAGSSGDDLAVICAISLNPTNLSIAGKQLSQQVQKKAKYPQIVRSNGYTVTIEDWKS